MAITNAQITAVTRTEVRIAEGEEAITCLIFCNTSADTDATVEVWLVPGAQAAGDTNMIINQVSVPAGETFSIDTERFILANGDSIQARASQNSVITCTVSYVSVG